MIVLRGLLALLIVAALAPEPFRYAAEHRLFHATAVVQAVFARTRDVRDPGRATAWAVSTASDAAADLPRDWRALNLEGSAFLLAGQPDRALDSYRRALAIGERPEIDLNIGRAFASLGRHEHATAAFLRATWISPALLSQLPAATRRALEPRLDALERSLVTGRLTAPPALPP